MSLSLSLQTRGKNQKALSTTVQIPNLSNREIIYMERIWK